MSLVAGFRSFVKAMPECQAVALVDLRVGMVLVGKRGSSQGSAVYDYALRALRAAIDVPNENEEAHFHPREMFLRHRRRSYVMAGGQLFSGLGLLAVCKGSVNISKALASARVAMETAEANLPGQFRKWMMRPLAEVQAYHRQLQARNDAANYGAGEPTTKNGFDLYFDADNIDRGDLGSEMNIQFERSDDHHDVLGD